MNNKIVKKVLFITILFLTFFGGIIKPSAVTVNTFLQPDKCNGTTNNKGNNLCNSNSTYSLKGSPSVSPYFTDRKLGNVGLYSYKENGKDYHAYCIEPGTPVAKGYSNSGIAFNQYSQTINGNKVNIHSINATKIKMVSQVLTFAQNLGTGVLSSGNKTERYKAYAAQGLIWEIITGERTTFSTNNGTNKPNNALSNGFWVAINKTKDGAVKEIAKEYDLILTKIRGTYEKSPKNFNPTLLLASKDPIPLTCTGETCSLTINDPNFNYWTVSSDDGLDVGIKGNLLSISTKSVIEKDAAKTITIKIKGNTSDKGATAYYHSGSSKEESQQDVVTISGLNHYAYLKVYTPKYQLKITKKTKSDVPELNELPLEGAKFNICYDSSCSKKVSETITTDKNGEAIYDKLDKPGTYYIKEISAPKGYEFSSSKVTPISVSSSNITGTTSYAHVTIENNTKRFDLIKYTVDEQGNRTKSNDGCGTSSYTGAKFQISENGKTLYFHEISQGIYKPASENTQGAVTELRTCNGEFKVYTLPNCKYTIKETKTPDSMINASKATKDVNICGSDKKGVEFTNGFTGLEFHKKDEDGNFLIGGKFSLQMKINNIYTDLLLKETAHGFYEYDAELDEKDPAATYIILTTGNSEEDEDKGKAFIKRLPPGEYRVVEKEAPEGYEPIEDKDSTAKVTIKDSEKQDYYYLVELVNQKVGMQGSSDSAELIVTITTGRKVPNYVVIISVLATLLVITIILRKRFKK